MYASMFPLTWVWSGGHGNVGLKEGDGDFYHVCELHVYVTNKTKQKKRKERGKKNTQSPRPPLSLSLLTHSLCPLLQPVSWLLHSSDYP